MPQLVAAYAANIGVHAILAGFTAFVTYLCFYRGIVLFSWHPPLMLLGVRLPTHSRNDNQLFLTENSLFGNARQFFILMTEAICCFIEPNIPTLGLHATRRKQLHWIMQCVAASSITAAFVIVLLNKQRIGKPHFATWHGLLGLLSIIASGVSMLGGLLALYAVQWRRWLRLRPALVRLLHSGAGIVAYGLGMVTIGFGCYSPFMAENATFQVQTVCAVLVGLVGVYAAVMPLWKMYGRVRQLVASD